jgi:hypothetical protein
MRCRQAGYFLLLQVLLASFFLPEVTLDCAETCGYISPRYVGSGGFPFRPVLVIARTHARERTAIVAAFLSSIRAQTFTDYNLWLVNGECPGKELFNDVISGANDNRFKAMRLGKNEECLKDSSYGYYTTDLAIHEILRLNSMGLANVKYVLLTNADNLYHHMFLETAVNTFSVLNFTPCIVASDWISRYAARNDEDPRALGNRNTLRHVQFKLYHIDLGCAVIAVHALSKAFIGKSEYFVKNSTTADWSFFEQILDSGKTCGIPIRQVLFVHQ